MHPAIVSQATFQQAQDRLAQRRKDKTPAERHKFVFTGLIYCGNCGSRMLTRLNKRRYVHRPVYICGSGMAYGPTVCRCRTIEEEDVVWWCASLLRDEVFKDFDADEWRVRLAAMLRRQVKDRPAESKRVRKELATLTAKIEQGNENYLLALPSLRAGLEAKLADWQRTHEALSKRLEELDRAVVSERDIGRMADHAVAKLKDICHHTAWAMPDTQAALFQSIVKRITVSFKDVPIRSILRSKYDRAKIELKADAFTIKSLCADMFGMDTSSA
jgi:hypothetical protein